MAGLPVKEAEFEVVRGPRRSTRRALWFSAFFVLIYVITANETERSSTLIILSILAAFTWPILNTYFPFVDRAWGPYARDFHLRKELDKEAALHYPRSPWRRSGETFFTFWTAFFLALDVQPEADPAVWWKRVCVVLAATVVWPLLCRIGDGIARKSGGEPVIKNWPALVMAVAALSGFVAFKLWSNSRSAAAPHSMTTQTGQTASTTVSP